MNQFSASTAAAPTPAARPSAALRVTILCPQSARGEHIARLLQNMADSPHIEQLEGPVQQLNDFDRLPMPDALIVDSVGDPMRDLESLERLGSAYPLMAILLVCEQPSPDFLMQAMRAGVREVLRAPVDGALLAAALERVRHKLGHAPAHQGKVFALMSCKGGSGATFLTANLAHALALDNREVVLFDLKLQFGDALLFLSSQNPGTTVADVARSIHRLDPALLASSMVKVDTRLSVLAAPVNPAQGGDVKLDHIDAMINMARLHYDAVLLDVGSTLDALTIKALDHADVIFVVLQTTLPYLRDGKRLLAAFRALGYPATKVKLIVNRYVKGREIGLELIEQTLGAKVMHTIPNHEDAVIASLNHGRPIARAAPASPVTHALRAWAALLAGGVAPQGPRWMPRFLKVRAARAAAVESI